MSLRRTIFWIHLGVGVTAAAVVLMMAVTGVLLTYEAQLNRWALRGYLADPHLQAGAPLTVDQLIPRVADPEGGREVSSVALKRDPREPAVVRLDDGATVYVDRYTGELLGDGNTRMRRFLRSVMYVHRWFGLEGEYRIIGRTLTATANLGFLFLVLSGAYLWWPSTHSRAAWRQVLWFRRGLRGRARNFNWHSVIGFWSAVPLAIIIASGATISYRWAGNLVYRLAGEAPPAQTSGQQTEPVTRDDPAGAPDTALPTVELQPIATRAIAETPDWQTVTVRLPSAAGDPVAVGVDRGTGRQPSKTEDLLFNRATGELVGRAGYPAFSRGQKIRRWLRFAHTGEVYGVVGQSIAGVVSLGVAVMVWTGLAMSWRRFFGSGNR